MVTEQVHAGLFGQHLRCALVATVRCGAPSYKWYMPQLSIDFHRLIYLPKTVAIRLLELYTNLANCGTMGHRLVSMCILSFTPHLLAQIVTK